MACYQMNGTKPRRGTPSSCRFLLYIFDVPSPIFSFLGRNAWGCDADSIKKHEKNKESYNGFMERVRITWARRD